MTERKKRVMAIVGLGGTGINIASRFGKASGTKEGYAETRTFYADTSDSNITPAIRPLVNDSNLFLTPDTDGGGGDRRKNVEKIAPHIPAVLNQLGDADFYVLVSSSGGATGNVFATLMAPELIKKGKSVVCVFIGAYESEQRTGNNVNTVKSVIGTANVHSIPMNVAFFSNNSEGGRNQVDIDVCSFIEQLAILTSGQNGELDSEDVWNFLNYQPNAAEGRKPQINFLEVLDNVEQLKTIKSPYAIAGLYGDRDNIPSLPYTPRYETSGFLPFTNGTLKNLFFVTTTGTVAALLKDHEAAHEKITQANSSVVTGLDMSQAPTTGNGLVF